MAKDLKTGKLITIEGRESIGKDEPIVILRARDPLARAALKCYGEIAETHGEEGTVSAEFLNSIAEAVDAFCEWASDNDSRMPD